MKSKDLIYSTGFSDLLDAVLTTTALDDRWCGYMPYTTSTVCSTFSNSIISYRTNILKDKYVISFDVCGLDKDKLDLNVKNNDGKKTLILETLEDSVFMSKGKAEVTIPNAYDITKIKSSLKNGLLEVVFSVDEEKFTEKKVEIE